MPLYAYTCPECGNAGDVFKKIAEIDRMEFCNACGAIAERKISAPRVLADYAPYECPITGEKVEGRKAHRENLAKHGCRIYEPGEKEAAASFRRRQTDALERDIDATIEEEIHSMPAVKRERLAAELQQGFSAEAIRV